MLGGSFGEGGAGGVRLDAVIADDVGSVIFPVGDEFELTRSLNSAFCSSLSLGLISTVMPHRGPVVGGRFVVGFGLLDSSLVAVSVRSVGVVLGEGGGSSVPGDDVFAGAPGGVGVVERPELAAASGTLGFCLSGSFTGVLPLSLLAVPAGREGVVLGEVYVLLSSALAFLVTGDRGSRSGPLVALALGLVGALDEGQFVGAVGAVHDVFCALMRAVEEPEGREGFLGRARDSLDLLLVHVAG